MLEQLMEKYLVDNTKKLEKVLAKFKTTFTEVDRLKTAMIKLNPTDDAQIKSILTKLTGYHMELDDIRIKLETLQTNKYLAYYHSKKVDAESSGTKFADGATKEEAKLYVADERRVVSHLEGKVSACIEGIRTCRALVTPNKKKSEEETIE